MRRLRRTRSTFSGAQRTLASDACVAATIVTPRASASAWRPCKHDRTSVATGASLSSSVSTPRRSWPARRDHRRAGRAFARVCWRSAGRYRSGSPTPSSRASSIAWMFASGVRRSWLAHATSCRRASNSPSMLAAIRWGGGQLGHLGGPVLRRTRREISTRQSERRRANLFDRPMDAAGQQQSRTERGRRGRDRHREHGEIVARGEHRLPTRERLRGEVQARAAQARSAGAEGWEATQAERGNGAYRERRPRSGQREGDHGTKR